MAGYNKENLLKKIVEVQNIVLAEQKRGYMNQKEVFNRIIAPKYFISERTFYNYLGRNAKKELADLKANNKRQFKQELNRV